MTEATTSIPRVLVIDDEPGTICLLHELLKSRYKVSWATDGSDGLALAQETLPDLILLDIQMPGMDGYEVCRHLRTSAGTWNIPVIFLTAQADAADLVRAYAVGGTDYLIKPVEPTELLKRVTIQVQFQQAKRDLEQRLQDVVKTSHLPGRIAS